MNLKEKIRLIPDFPKKGILFRDITTLLKEKEAFNSAINALAKYYKKEKIDKIVAVESRGFIIGGALSYKMKTGFVPVRKPGKLPAKTISVRYNLEYGKDSLEIHKDAIKLGERILIVDDLLATGGTVLATKKMVEKLGGKIVGFLFLIELCELKGRDKLKNYSVKTLILD